MTQFLRKWTLLAALSVAGILPLLAPSRAEAWWVRGGCCFGGIVVAPPVVVAPPIYAAPIYAAPPPVYYAPAPYYPPRRVWIPAHWYGGYYVRGHWA